MEKARDIPAGTRKLYSEPKVDESVQTLLMDCYMELKSLEDGTGDYATVNRVVGRKVGGLLGRLKKLMAG